MDGSMQRAAQHVLNMFWLIKVLLCTYQHRFCTVWGSCCLSFRPYKLLHFWHICSSHLKRTIHLE